jgi:mono/diheme cytochrome c family protein
MEHQAARTHERRRTVFLAVALGALAALVAGCGALGYTSAKADKANGKKLFSAKCGSCHTLADAGTTGIIGPDLDYAFKQDLAVGMTEGTIRQVVRGQIAYAITETSTGSPGMPKNLVTGKDANDVAAYVASVAGKTAGTPTPTPAPPPPPVSTSTTSEAPATTTTAGAPDAATLATGKQAFAANGCGGCHTLKAAGSGGQIGPDLDNLAADAKTAGQLLDAYIRESIVKPNAYVVSGFQPNVMPGTFGETLTAPQLNGLIAYLLAAVSGK